LALPGYLTIFFLPGWLVIFGLAHPLPWSWLAGSWSGTILVCGGFWRFGWRRSAARQLYLWEIVGMVGTVLLFALVFALVIGGRNPDPHTDSSWLIAFWATFGLGLSAGLTVVNIASRLRKEDRRR
jgi:hypothetical protein